MQECRARDVPAGGRRREWVAKAIYYLLDAFDSLVHSVAPPEVTEVLRCPPPRGLGLAVGSVAPAPSYHRFLWWLDLVAIIGAVQNLLRLPPGASGPSLVYLKLLCV